jgi:DNA primase
MPQPYVDFGHVKEHASFERVLAHYQLALTGHGVQRAVLCPFHRERRPSCKVELDRKIFHCFGCGQKGNILEFVATLDKSDLRTAALKIATICTIAPAPPRDSGRKPAQKREEKSAPPVTPQAPRGTAQPPDGREAVAEPVNPPLTFELKLDGTHPYLNDRGLSAETVAAFGLGYCNRGLMKGRICIPIHDAAGNLVAYAGRWADAGELPEGEDKYKLPAKFQKSRLLFNLNRIEDAAHLVAVEGFWSAIRLHTLGIPTVALMGWSLSADQIALLRERGTRSLVLLLDGDEAGYQARERLLPELANSFFVRSPKLPEGEKPDTLDEALLRELVRVDFP